MLIWKGHGILILVFGILGGLLTGFLVASVFAVTGWEWMLRMVGPANVWGAAIAIWLYGRTIGKTVTKTYLDPATRRHVEVKSSHTLFFIPPLPWAVLVAVMACVATVNSFNKPAEDFMSDAQLMVAAPGKAAFKEANRLIDMDKGKTAYGNTPDAEKLAATFSETVMKGRELGVETGKKSAISLSHGKFLSYCRINPDSCVFMVHVPDLRNFTAEAKKFMVGMAWTVAREKVADLRPQPQKLVVGVRGAVLYDEVVEGPVPKIQAGGDEDEDWQAGIERRFSSSNATNRLESYFEPHAAGVVLPKLAPADELAKKTADTAPQTALSSTPAGRTPPPSATTSSMPPPSAPPSGASVNAAVSPIQKVEILLKWFPTTKPGEVAGNADAVNQLALNYAGFVHDRVSINPALGGMTLPDPCFSAYVHLRDDTAAFLLALPAGSDLSLGAFKVFQDEAWRMAAVASAQMSPIPARIAVITFNEGQMDLMRIGSPRNQGGTEWLVEQELPGTQGKDVLAPFVAASSKPLITVNSPLTLQTSVKSLLAANRHVRAAVPAPAPAVPAAASASPPLLPTPVRDWKDATGRAMQASLESFTTPAKDAGRFKRADGQLFEVPFSRLSAEDQAFIRKIAEQQ